MENKKGMIKFDINLMCYKDDGGGRILKKCFLPKSFVASEAYDCSECKLLNLFVNLNVVHNR